MQPPLASLDVIEDMLDAPSNLDWVGLLGSFLDLMLIRVQGLWDQQIRLEDRETSVWNDPGEIDKMFGNTD